MSDPLLVVLAGAPGVGKTTLARTLAPRLDATHVRIDSIEQALRRAGIDPREEGYAVAMAVARDQLILRHAVVADAVNAVPQARAGWRQVADQTQARVVMVQVTCSNGAEHRRRVEQRRSDIEGHALPEWAAVQAREIAAWDLPPLWIDTAGRTVEACVDELLAQLQAHRGQA